MLNSFFIVILNIFYLRDPFLYRKVHHLLFCGKHTPINKNTIPEIITYKGGLVTSSLKNSIQNTPSEE